MEKNFVAAKKRRVFVQRETTRYREASGAYYLALPIRLAVSITRAACPFMVSVVSSGIECFRGDINAEINGGTAAAVPRARSFGRNERNA